MPSDHQIHVCVNGQLYDLTDFSTRHPGGPIKAYHGADATETFGMYHDPSFIQRLRPYHMGPCMPNKSKK
jgi:cytochrome b involved in lipid metabolism